MTNNQRPTINTIVTETKKQLSNLKNNFKEEKKLKVDKLYLHFLGLVEETDSSNNIKKCVFLLWRHVYFLNFFSDTKRRVCNFKTKI